MSHTRRVRIAVAADELTGIAVILPVELGERGHELLLHGALTDGEQPDWALSAAAAAREGVGGAADQAIVCGSGPTAIGIFWGADAARRARAALDRVRPRYPQAVGAGPVRGGNRPLPPNH